MVAKINEDKARIESARKKTEEKKKGKANDEAVIAVQMVSRSSSSEYCPNVEVEMIKREESAESLLKGTSPNLLGGDDDSVSVCSEKTT